jgi:hypothetical protein
LAALPKDARALEPSSRLTSHLSAVLLVVLLALTAPTLFEYCITLTLPLFGGLLSSAASASLPPDPWFSVGTPLLKLLSLLFLLSIAATAGALSIRRALSR